MTINDLQKAIADDNVLDVKLIRSDHQIETLKRGRFFAFQNHPVIRIEAGAAPKTVTAWIYENDAEKFDTYTIMRS